MNKIFWKDFDIQAYVELVSSEDFGLIFKDQAKWNSRLRTTGGRFFPKDFHLDFNPKIYMNFDLMTFRKIVRHELVHYHLYRAGKGYRHQDQDFKLLLKEVDGLRYTPTVEQLNKTIVYKKYICSGCGMEYLRKRKIDTRKFVCGKCRSKLKEIK